MKRIEMSIVALSHSVTQSHNYAVVLGEKDGKRRLPIVIGGFEAQAIAVALEKMTPNRPLTHDLFKSTLETFGVKLQQVVISNLLDGIFYAQMICEKDGEIIEIDSRTSDAIAMAVRYDCPIYTFEFIMEAAGVILDDEGSKKPEKTKASSAERKRKGPKTIQEMDKQELESLLSKVLEKEDYEKAAEIRDELNRRFPSES